MTRIDKRWTACLKLFKANVAPLNYRTWFEPILFMGFEKGTVKIMVPTQFFMDWLEEHYIVLIKKVLFKTFKGLERIEYVVIIPPDWVYKEKESKPDRVEIITNIHENLIADLRKEPTIVHKITPVDFEELVAFLLRKRGYEIYQTPRSKDGGKDLIARFKSPIGDDCVCYVECKKYNLNNPVGVEYIRSLYGVVESDKVNVGMLVTTSHFTKGAKAFETLHQNRLKLKDFQDLKEWFNLGHGDNGS